MRWFWVYLTCQGKQDFVWNKQKETKNRVYKVIEAVTLLPAVLWVLPLPSPRTQVSTLGPYATRHGQEDAAAKLLKLTQSQFYLNGNLLVERRIFLTTSTCLKENCNAKTSWFHLKGRSKCCKMRPKSLKSATPFSSYSALKLSQGITKGESPCFQKFSDIFGNMRLVPLKMTSHLASHNFQILKIEIFSKLCKIWTCNLKR